MEANIRIAALAGACIVFVTFVVLLFDATVTGDFTYSTAYLQYTPQEACSRMGCVWDLEVQRGAAINSPHHAPMAGCICGEDEFVYVPIKQRIY